MLVGAFHEAKQRPAVLSRIHRVKSGDPSHFCRLRPLSYWQKRGGLLASRLTPPMLMMKRSLALLALLVSTTALPAAPASVEGFTYVKSLGGIDEYRLDSNGLQVLLLADHSAPVEML